MTMQEAITIAGTYAVQLHVHPECSGEEVETTRIIRAFCERCGVRLVELGMQTGAVAVLDCGRAETVALRADIDAVDTVDGPAHLCGHDHHAAGLMGAMAYLAAHRAQLPYNVVFLFQPAEETISGARAMLEHGLMQKLGCRPVRLFGIHNQPKLPCGQVVVHEGALMAGKTDFTLRFTGRTGHGSTPHACIDPMVAAGQFIVGAQSVVSRNVDPMDAAVCAVCSCQCGTPANFAPEMAELTGSVRTLRMDTHARVFQRLEQLAQGIAAAFECTAVLTRVTRSQSPVVENHPAVYPYALRAAQKAGQITDLPPCLGAEDFAVLAQEMPGFFYWVGSGEAGRDNAAWHSRDFRVAGDYLKTAVPLLIYAATETGE